DIMNIRQYVNEIPMAEEVEAFALRLVIGTHPEVPGANDTAKKYISCGASPRAAQAIFKTAKARALLDGRYNVSFDDIEAVALPALRHRVTLSFEALAEGITTDQVIKKIMSSIPKD
ncbi:MAG: AAA family ATPase, partial [Lachnospiraceae bacterium]|nr:AAA family ATPase [Lachnospiraceae bacterium]